MENKKLNYHIEQIKRQIDILTNDYVYLTTLKDRSEFFFNHLDNIIVSINNIDKEVLKNG